VHKVPEAITAALEPHVSRGAKICALMLFVFILGMTSVKLGSDADYDMRNYHIYNGYAFFNKRLGYDLAPAQVQSYFAPLIDALYYLAIKHLNDFPAVMTFVWTLPSGLAAFLIVLLGLRLLNGERCIRFGLALVAAAIGSSGAMTIATMGLSMSEAIINCLMLTGLLLVLGGEEQNLSPYRISSSGALFGMAAALKLTAASYAIGVVVSHLLRPGVRLATRARGVLLCVACMIVGSIVFAGPWWFAVYRVFANPLFPFYNHIFRSPLFGDFNFFGPNYTPPTILDALLYPIYWGISPRTITSEVPVRDPRLAIGLICAIITMCYRFVGNRPSAGGSSVGLFFVSSWFLSSFIIWEAMFSIARYAACLELLSGVLVIATLQYFLSPRIHLVVSILLAPALITFTIYPDWRRLSICEVKQVVDVRVPKISPDSLIIILDGAPESYLAMFLPASVRWISVNNNLVKLDSTFGFQGLIIRRIAGFPGPIWGLEKTDYRPGEADKSLTRYGLRRVAGCMPVPSNLDSNLRLCPLARVSAVTLPDGL
jgi:hypothetical protein